MSLVRFLDERFYPEVQKNWDDMEFRNRILQTIEPHHTVLDMGAGAGIIPFMNFRGKVRSMIGIDLDLRVKENPYLDHGVVGDVTATPFESGTFDVIFCDNVMEHIEEPIAFLKEVERLLKPGGVFLGKTPNKYHYMPIIASLTPLWFHKVFNNYRGRKVEDTFPTHYKLNSPKTLKSTSNACGLEVCSIELIEGRPEYLRMSALTYIFGIIYERIVNRFSMLKPFAVLLVVKLQKSEKGCDDI